MKLSFSTKGWHENTFEEFCDIAVDLKFEGIELHNINNRLFTDRDGAFHDYAAAATLRRLYEKKLQLPCIDTLCNLSDDSLEEVTLDEIRRCIAIAGNLHIPNIRLKAYAAEDSALEGIARRIETVLPEAEEKGVTLLLETSGIFAKTAVLREILNRFASDHLAVLWNFSAAYFDGGESSEEIIQNLGAYVRHVHIKDAVKTVTPPDEFIEIPGRGVSALIEGNHILVGNCKILKRDKSKMHIKFGLVKPERIWIRKNMYGIRERLYQTNLYQ